MGNCNCRKRNENEISFEINPKLIEFSDTEGILENLNLNQNLNQDHNLNNEKAKSKLDTENFRKFDVHDDTKCDSIAETIINHTKSMTIATANHHIQPSQEGNLIIEEASEDNFDDKQYSLSLFEIYNMFRVKPKKFIKKLEKNNFITLEEANQCYNILTEENININIDADNLNNNMKIYVDNENENNLSEVLWSEKLYNNLSDYMEELNRDSFLIQLIKTFSTDLNLTEFTITGKYDHEEAFDMILVENIHKNNLRAMLIKDVTFGAVYSINNVNLNEQRLITSTLCLIKFTT
jgi:hypothetical protein